MGARRIAQGEAEGSTATTQADPFVSNDMSPGMRDKAVFIVTREMAGRAGTYSRAVSAMAGGAERKAYRFLPLAGFKIVLFASDSLVGYAERHEGNGTCEAVVRRTKRRRSVDGLCRS
jgi:hypothetical protein